MHWIDTNLTLRCGNLLFRRRKTGYNPQQVQRDASNLQCRGLGLKEIGGNVMTKVIHGKVRGKTIELAEDLGLAKGQEVEVQISLRAPAKKWGDGILRTAGALADDPYWDAIMEEIYQSRKIDRPPQPKALISVPLQVLYGEE
jgi:hypothetical protein